MRKYFLWLLFLLLTPTLFSQDNDTCIDCHEDAEMEVVRYGVAHSLTVSEDDFEGTPHEGFDCIECHTDMDGIDEFPHAPTIRTSQLWFLP